MRNTRLAQGVGLHPLQCGTSGAQLLVSSGPLQNLHGFQPGDRCDRVPGQRAQLHQPLVRAHRTFVKVLHDLGRRTYCGKRESPANNLAKRTDVRHHAVALLCTAIGEPKASDDFVKYQQHAVFVAKIGQPLQKPRLRWNDPLQGLDNDGGNIVVLVHQRRDRFKIVERGNHHLICNTLRNAGTVGNRVREIDTVRGGKTHLGFGAHPVISAFELQDLVAPRMGPRKPDSIHIRLAAGSDKPNLFTAGDCATDGFAQLNPFRVVGEESHALGQLLKYSLHDFRVAMPKQHRAGPDQIVDIFIVVLIPDPTPFATGDDNVGIEITKTTGGQDLMRTRDPFILGANLFHWFYPVLDRVERCTRRSKKKSEATTKQT